jgi:hypothetical protein
MFTEHERNAPIWKMYYLISGRINIPRGLGPPDLRPTETYLTVQGVSPVTTIHEYPPSSPLPCNPSRRPLLIGQGSGLKQEEVDWQAIIREENLHQSTNPLSDKYLGFRGILWD